MAVSFTIIKRQFSSTSLLRNVFNHVTIIGGGLMGSGIAQVTAHSGMDVTIVEVNEEAAQKSNANIASSMQRVAKKLFQNSAGEAEKYISETMGRLKVSTDLNEAVSKTDLVVEAIVENLPAKHRLFSRIDTIAPENTIFASNTSSIPIAEIASVTLRKDRFGGLHFFNPVPVMKLLEVVRTEETSEDTYQKLLNWGKAIGKTCITCKDTPGFVVNRLLVPYLAEAVRMLERDVATSRDIDVAMKLGAGYPMGPLELLDYVGLDTTKFILDGWHEKFPENPLFKPIPLLEKMVSDGKLGKKSGEGFYSYKKNTGNVMPVHSPYFQPLASAVTQILPPEPPREQARFVVPKKVKVERNDLHRNLADDLARATMKEDLGRPGPMKEELGRMTAKDEPTKVTLKEDKPEKSERYKSLDKWKNTEEFLCERDKQNLGYRKLTPKRGSKNAEKYLESDAFRAPKKGHKPDDWTTWKGVPTQISYCKWVIGKF